MNTPDTSTTTSGANVAGETPPAPVREQVRVRDYLISLKTYYVVLLLIAAFSLWLRKGIPVYAIATGVYDDALLIRTARYLRSGDWLGPYDNLTLAKGMFYPLFICAASFVAIPLKIAEQAAYLAASALTAELVRRRAGNPRLALILFALLAFNPVLWNVALARVIREGLYVSLSLALVTLTIVIAFPTRAGGRGRSVFQGFCLGLIGGAFWLTREEGIWLLPALAVVVVVALIGILRPDWVPRSERWVFPRRSDHFKAIALRFAVAVTVFCAADGLVAEINYRHYGIFETTEFRAKSWLHAYGALARIQHNEWQHYVPFPTDARQRAYSVSPAARELAPFLEGPLGESWRIEGCSHVDIASCSEVPSGWFGWELRDAMTAAGHYGSAVEAMHFYDRLADEIDVACDRGRIDCLPPRATQLPPFRWEYVAETVRSAKATAKVLFTMGDGQVGSAPSVGSRQKVKALADFIGGDVSPSSTVVIQGWAAAVSATPTIQLFMHGETHAFALITTLPAQDLVAAHPDFSVRRFQLETDCPIEACYLVVGEPGGQVDKVPMAQLVPGARFDTGQSLLTIETKSVPGIARLPGGAQVKIAAAYAIAFPILSIFGAAGLLLAILFQRLRPIPASLLALGLGSLVAVVTRIALLAYIDAAIFPAATLLYASPASPFVIIFTVVGIYSGGSFILRGNR
jgi:hypothetical protein